MRDSPDGMPLGDRLGFPETLDPIMDGTAALDLDLMTDAYQLGTRDLDLATEAVELTPDLVILDADWDT